MRSDMKSKKEHYQSREIAEQQLTDALDMFEKGRYISSLTLSGAAEEIFGKMPSETRSHADKDDGEMLNFFEASSSRLSDELGIDLKQIRKEMNKPRNVAKHYIPEHKKEDGTFMISQGSVESMLIRCIAQYVIAVDQSSIPEQLKEKYSRFLIRVMPAHIKQLNKDGVADATPPIS